MENPFKKIYVETKDGLVDITDLSKDQYEVFLQLTVQLSLAYWTIVQEEERKLKNKQQ